MDSNTILMQVKTGTAPANWRVLPAKSGHFIGSGIGFIVIGLLFFAGLAYLFLSGTIIYILIPPVNDGLRLFWFLADIVVGGLAGIGLIIGGVQKFIELGSADQQMLVLMPDGFLMQIKNPLLVSYGAVSGMTMATDRGSVNLLLRRADNGQTMKVALDSRFGAAKTIAQSIVSAQAQFAQARAMAAHPQG